MNKVCGEDEGDGWVQEKIAWKIGSGDKVRLWEDAWVENSYKLSLLYPRLYSVSLDQGKTVGEVGRYWGDSKWLWWLSWRRVRFDWESILEGEMFNLINIGNMDKENLDQIVWKGDPTGIFFVKSAYMSLSNQPSGYTDDVFNLLWQAKATPKALITAWKILLDRLPTSNNLIKRGMMGISPVCMLCKATEESSHHLFLECIYAQRVWYLCYRWFGILFVQHNDIKHHFENFHLVFLSSNQNKVWKGMWVTIVRCIWEQRNLVVFKQGVSDAEEIFHSAQLSSWLRLKHRVSTFNFVLSDWVMNPSLCLQSC